MQQELAAFSRYYDQIISFFLTYSFQVIGAILIFIIGFMVARWASGLVNKLCIKHRVDVTLSLFIASCVKLIIIAMVLIVCLGKFGVSVAPFVAAIGALSLSIGLALQGVFSNYGAGFTIILTRPFVVGNTINVNGVSGIVKEIKLAHTILTNEDSEQITIPNKKIVGEVLINSFENKLVEGQIGIHYQSDIEQAICLIQQKIAETTNQNHIQTNPTIGIESFGDSAIVIGYRYQVPSQQFFELQYQVNLAILSAFNQHKIDIPYPQRTVQLLQTPC